MTTFQIEVTTRTGAKKIMKDAITMRPRSFETMEDAQAFADSSFALARCDWKKGRRLPRFRVIEMTAA